jgi:hypothetical protein
MPDRRVHNRAAEILLGAGERDANRVNALVDNKLALALLGPRHRRFGHDLMGAALVALTSSNPYEDLKIWALHVALDRAPRKAQRLLALLLD